jgi:hypothetical protein
VACDRVLHPVASGTVPPNVEVARQQWEEGSRRFGQLSRGPHGNELVEQVEALVAELRKRVGAHFTLAQLVESYHGAERWAYETLAERDETTRWSASATTALDAAYHRFARGARDYAP